MRRSCYYENFVITKNCFFILTRTKFSQHGSKSLYRRIYCKNYLQAFNCASRISFTNVFTRWQQWRLRNCDITVGQKTEATPPMASARCSILPASCTCPISVEGGFSHPYVDCFLQPPREPWWIHLQDLGIRHAHRMVRVINLDVSEHLWGRWTQVSCGPENLPSQTSPCMLCQRFHRLHN